MAYLINRPQYTSIWPARAAEVYVNIACSSGKNIRQYGLLGRQRHTSYTISYSDISIWPRLFILKGGSSLFWGAGPFYFKGRGLFRWAGLVYFDGRGLFILRGVVFLRACP